MYFIVDEKVDWRKETELLNYTASKQSVNPLLLLLDEAAQGKIHDKSLLPKDGVRFGMNG